MVVVTNSTSFQRKIRRIDEANEKDERQVEKIKEEEPPEVTQSQQDQVFSDKDKQLESGGHEHCDHECNDSVGHANVVGDKAVVFSLHNQVGGLVRALRVFQVIETDQV